MDRQFQPCESHIRGVAIKDFVWQKNANGVWDPAWVPLGQGMVRFPMFFSMLAKTAFDGPMQLHFEYPLGGADAGKRQLTIDREQVFAAMRRDLQPTPDLLPQCGSRPCIGANSARPPPDFAPCQLF